MSETNQPEHGRGNGQFPESPRPLPDAATRQRRIGRELLSESDAIAQLLASETAAIGSEEVGFLGRLRDRLIARAEELGENAVLAERSPSAQRSQNQQVPQAQNQPAPTPAQNQQAPARGAGPLDLARVVLVCYLMFLFAFMGYLFAKSHLLHVDVTTDITDMFKLFLLPTLMLVLGYFFGASKN